LILSRQGRGNEGRAWADKDVELNKEIADKIGVLEEKVEKLRGFL
jgi:hypothetical protein